MLRTKVAKSTINWAHTQAELHTQAIQLCKEPNKKERDRSKEGDGGNFHD